MKRLLLLGGVLVACLGTADAQTGSRSGRVRLADPAQQAQDLANFRVAMANASALAKLGNLAATEAALTPLNKAKANTAEWHLETAQRLLQVAEQLARAAQPANVAGLANAAVSHATLAQTLAKTAPVQAAAKTLEGTIYEHYLANPTAALASYQAAVKLSPTKAKKAQEAAERLQQINDNLAAKAGGR